MAERPSPLARPAVWSTISRSRSGQHSTTRKVSRVHAARDAGASVVSQEYGKAALAECSDRSGLRPKRGIYLGTLKRHSTAYSESEDEVLALAVETATDANISEAERLH